MASIGPEKIRNLIIIPTEHDQFRDLLVKVFERLPEEAAEILIKERRVRFVLASSNQAIYLAGDHWLVVLEDDFFYWPEAEQLYTVAHELAHVYLKHRIGTVKTEFLADRRVVRWGFEVELEAVENNYLRGYGMEQVFGVSLTGEIKERR